MPEDRMDMQLILVIVCVGAALAYMVRRARKAVKGGGCCGCDSAGKGTSPCGCSREKQECEGSGKPEV